ncbi:glutamate-1-semialdehyde 2,1-aminomutase [Sneathiella chinensis]|uniref:Glutamate-1-semialdehyde 2,1-aminomutase n=2 Tax=Sneathiella chinensis TaxID=349750 RepID=A0ABQ5U8L6_9PROT|nr:glutamate-1-semialdehyde 2,1-aminomutase [Sneathiella chinensis]
MSALDRVIDDLKEEYSQRNPRSQAMMAMAENWMPGGNTRSVLHFDPFPLVIERGEGAYLHDVDGHVLLDCVGEFSAGLYGHSDPQILGAVSTAMASGIVLGAPNLYEARLAELVCERFPSVDLVRFCNSGTEANVLAAVTARHVTGRSAIVVFDGAYHGGVMTFGGGGNPMNVPFDWIVLPYNDAEQVRKTFAEEGRRIAAAFVEPVLGAAGNIAGQREFLQALRDETEKSGSVLIFDEVKTSRLGSGGVQKQLGITPDLTTLGKYLGGGFPLGAFGGSERIMSRFNPRIAGNLSHAGTFNNNVCSMAAGSMGLSEVFSEEIADAFLEKTETFRQQLDRDLKALSPRFHVSGMGSLISIHLRETAPERAADTTPASLAFRRVLNLTGLLSGVAFTGRGDIFLSLPMTDQDLATIRAAILKTAGEYGALCLEQA